jgi:hypothetical protein
LKVAADAVKALHDEDGRREHGPKDRLDVSGRVKTSELRELRSELRTFQ